ncbi:MAG: efflux RND transporter permease subunit [Patescibacteria group bacterium]
MKLTALCIKRPVTTGMFFTALIVLGLLSASRMPIDLFPEIAYPAVSISTAYAGAGPQEIERLITIPIERAVSTVNQVNAITSSSQEGSSRVTVNFNWGMNLDEAANDIRAVIDRVRRRLPDDADTPVVSKFDPSSAPVMTLGLSGRTDEAALRKLAEDDLSYLLQRVEGVASVEIRGGKRREIRVYLKQDRLQSLGLTADQIANTLGKENSMSPAGHLAIGAGDYLLRAQGEYRSIEEIRDLVVASREGVTVRLRDLAVIEDGFETTQSFVRIDGNPGIVISVTKRSGANTVAVADRLYKVLEQFAAQHPEEKVRILNDNSVYIRRAVSSVLNSGLIGAVLAGLILLFFLHNFRATIVACLAMPISIMTTLILAYFNRMTLNTISLGGLALGIGMLVDNSVVVLDNIFRRYQRDPDAGISAAAYAGTAEMGPALTASTLTTTCVFFPLIFVTGRSGIIFKELSYMVIFSILCSLMVALTLLPMLCSKFLHARDLAETERGRVQGFFLRLQHRWEESYQKTLSWCLAHKLMVILGCLVLFLFTLLMIPFIGTELVQNTDEGVISVNLQLPTGTRLEETDLNARNLEAKLGLLPELENMEVSVGGGGGSSNQARLTLRLKNRAERKRSTQEIVADLQERLQIPGARLRISAQNSMRFLYGGSQSQIAVDIRGYDQSLTQQIAFQVQEKLEHIPGIANVSVSRDEERPELSIAINRKRAADYGVTADQITSAIRTNIEGKVATVYREAGEETQIRVNLQESDRKSWQDLGRILVAGSNNRIVPLTSVVDLIQANSPVGIGRKDQERNVTVSAGLYQRDLASAMADVRKVIAEIPLPPGVNVHYAGDYEEQQRSFNELLVAFILALALVYMVMASQFESFLDPFVIMLAVPFALSGVFTILLFTGTNFNSQVYIGLIMLGGIVVNNAIVMISYFRIMMAGGADLRQAVLNGARTRLRPILMTTTTTLLALIPLALGLGEGSETQSPLARTVIGGLTFSTILTLFLIPVLFISLEETIAKARSRISKAKFVTTAVVILILGMTLVSPHPAAAEPVRRMTVSEAIDLALQNSEEGRIIRQKRESAASAYRESIGGKSWRLSSSLAASYGDQGTIMLGLDLEKTFAPLANQIAAYNRTIAMLACDLQEQNLIHAVVVAFQQELLAERDVRLAEENLERSRAFLEEVQTRAKLGLTNISDEIGAQTQAAAAETALRRSRQLQRLARIKLRHLLNLDDDAELELVPPPAGKAPPAMDGLLKEALNSRADLKQAEASLEQAQILLRLAKLAEKQGIALDWKLERDGYEAGISLTNRTGTEGAAGEWKIGGSLGVSLTGSSSTGGYADYGTISLIFMWDLFDGGVRRERVKQAESFLCRIDEERKKLQKTIGLEVQEAYYNLQYQQDRLQGSRLQLDYSSTHYEAVAARLRVGLATVKDVLDAQVLRQNAELEYERAKIDLYLAGIALMKATGSLSAHAGALAAQ